MGLVNNCFVTKIRTKHFSRRKTILSFLSLLNFGREIENWLLGSADPFALTPQNPNTVQSTFFVNYKTYLNTSFSCFFG